jgi:hypothetical protein
MLFRQLVVALAYWMRETRGRRYSQRRIQRRAFRIARRYVRRQFRTGFWRFAP